MYADYSWFIDDNHYVIFEHLGQDTEEKEWADYRIDEGKGIMLWGKLTTEFNELTMGYEMVQIFQDLIISLEALKKRDSLLC